jgi:deoxyribonuclease-4
MDSKIDKELSIISSIKWDVGSHTEFSKCIYNTIEKSIFSGMNVTQFFLGSPKCFTRHRTSDEDINKTLEIIKHFPLHIFSHFPYVSNLAGSVKQLAWTGNKEQDSKTHTVIKELEYELSVISKLKSNGKKNGVVIHPGNFEDRHLGISTIAKSINKINFVEGSTLILENAAGQGCSLATTFKEIKEIYDHVDKEKQKHIGVCVDTAHICGYGEYDLSKCSEVNRMFEEFDNIIGIEKFTLLHLNDSVVELGSKRDCHACIGTGHIWKNDFSSLILLLDRCKQYGIPILLETDALDMLTLASISDSTQN